MRVWKTGVAAEAEKTGMKEEAGMEEEAGGPPQWAPTTPM